MVTHSNLPSSALAVGLLGVSDRYFAWPTGPGVLRSMATSPCWSPLNSNACFHEVVWRRFPVDLAGLLNALDFVELP